MSAARPVLLGLLLLLIGCGPTRTAGTSGLSRHDLAVLTVPQLPNETHLRIETIRFDDSGDAYPIGHGRDFYLLPRDHTAAFTLKVVIDEAGFFGRFVPKDALTFPVPPLPLGPMSAGRAYELAVPTDGFGQLLQTGQRSPVREKKKAK